MALLGHVEQLLCKTTPSGLNEVVGLSTTYRQTDRQNEETEEYYFKPNLFQAIELGKSHCLKEMEISNLPFKELKVMVIKILTDVKRRMNDNSENFNKETESVRKYETEVIVKGK